MHTKNLLHLQRLLSLGSKFITTPESPFREEERLEVKGGVFYLVTSIEDVPFQHLWYEQSSYMGLKRSFVIPSPPPLDLWKGICA